MKQRLYASLQKLYSEHNTPLLIECGQLLAPAFPRVAASFYAELMTDGEAREFLDNEQVDRQLKGSMAAWLTTLFVPLRSEELEGYAARQRQVGQVHARINIPLHLVNDGLRILKREMCREVISSPLPREQIADAVVLINDLVDFSGALINESYLVDMVDNERNAQSMRLHQVSHNLAIECERLRAHLFDWLRRTLTSLYQNETAQLCPGHQISHSDFGLWVYHKAELLFPDYEEVEKIEQQLERIDLALAQAIAARPEGIDGAFSQAVREMNEAVTQSAWLLSSLIDHALEMENVRDPMTRLLTRRYLPTVMQREIRLSLRHRRPFAAMMVDIDHFKQLNDTWGHATGDVVLSQFSELLLNHLRASDFIFRYGGEEFLVILSDCDGPAAFAIAEKLRQAIAAHPFRSHSQQPLQLTTSLGIALHDGHPDYLPLIARADAALYRAKEGGRNRVELES